MRHRGFNTRGIQTGPFTDCLADFVPKNFQLLAKLPIINHFLLGAENEEKRITQKGNETQGFLGLFRLGKKLRPDIPGSHYSYI